MKKGIIRQIGKSLNVAQSICVAFVSHLEDVTKIKCKSIHLKCDTLNDYSVLFVIPEKIFLDFDKFSEVNSCWNGFLQQHTSPIKISCMFMPFSRNINKHAIAADGYVYNFKNG